MNDAFYVLDPEGQKVLVSSTTNNIFLLTKNRGRLCFPGSNCVKEACRILEIEFQNITSEITRLNFHNKLTQDVYSKAEHLFTADHFKHNSEHKKQVNQIRLEDIINL